MRNKTLRNSLLAITGILIAAFVIWQLTKTYTSAEPLSESDAIDIVEKMYSGKNPEVSLEGDVYKITFENKQGNYEIDVHRKTGDIINLTKISEKSQEKTEAEIREILAKEQAGEIKTIDKKIEQDEVYYYATVVEGETGSTYKLQAITGEIVDVVQNGKEPQNASEQVPSTPEPPVQQISEQQAIELALQHVKGVVDEVELEEEEGQYSYFVEVETDQGEEKIVQVHAISGEVISIVLED
ncbi:PepSY domain-containing protein [Bacillus timonensis]|uniref:PepSY domain-containing protein n=1 Tax=Bacillus timonensis TaxID=1033734 RepID=UPI00028803CA|nr:PepSY domain-containing protein [Bacillus timonensis]